jgi:protein-disulfide isomerase
MDLTEPVTDADHIRGDGDLELVMYGDFECPYCVAAQRILARVEQRLGDRLRFVFRHFPLAEVHPNAVTAAEASEAAADQRAFWEMHDALYGAGGRLSAADVLGHARKLGLDAGRIETELRERVHRERVERDLASGRAAGVTGTPGFFTNGVRLGGAFDAASIVEALRASGT